MAKISEKWILDLEVQPTRVSSLTPEAIEEALYALQVKGASGEKAEQVVLAALVAIVAHLKQHGYQRAVSLDDDPILEDAITPPMG